MELEIFALCDAATESGGKLNLLGAFDALQVAAFPSPPVDCCLAARIRFQRIENGEHIARVCLIDADGKPVSGTLSVKFNVNMPTAFDTAAQNLVVKLRGLKFPRPGRYALDLAIDGRQERSLPLTLMPVQAGPKTRAPDASSPIL